MSSTILGDLITKGHLNSDFIGNVGATQNGATQWTINSDFIWEGDTSLGNPTFNFESLPYTITITHGGASTGTNMVSVTITDAAIGAVNGGNDTVTVTTPNETSTSTGTVASALATAINNNSILHAAGYTATHAGAKITLQPGPGDNPSSVTAPVTGVITDTIAPPSTTDANGNTFTQVAIAPVGSGGVGAYANYDVLAWNQGNLLLGLPDGTGGYNQFLQLSDTNLNPVTLPKSFYPVTVAQSGNFVVPCFTAGTLIATADGEAPVEHLCVGEAVRIAAGGLRRVVWIGHRRVDCRHHKRPREVWPVRIAAGAFGEFGPRRELWLSPDHAVLVDEVLIPIKCLVNGATITQVPVDEVDYYHVELPRHEVLLAEGLPAESYLDTGNRPNFSNHDGSVAPASIGARNSARLTAH